MTTPLCLVCGEPLKISGQKKPYLGCPNGCTQTMVRKNIDKFEERYGKNWKGGSSAAPAAKSTTPTATEKETERAPARAKTLDEEFSS